MPRYHAPMLHQSILTLHLLSAIFWLGGMATLHFCVRPAALEILVAPQPIVLMQATLKRFLRLVGVAAVLLLLTGIHLYGQRGGMGARWGVHVMAGGGIVMMFIYDRIRALASKKLAPAVASQSWPEAKAALDGVRKLVAVNLCLGVSIVLAVKLGA